MALLPKVKLKMLPAYPSSILGGAGIETTKHNGSLVVDLAFGEFDEISAIPTSPTSSVLTYDPSDESYVRIPSSLLGGAVAGISDAPIDSVLYGRKNAAWVAAPLATPPVPPSTITATGSVSVAATATLLLVNAATPANTDFLLPSLAAKVGAVTIWDAAGVFHLHTYRVLPNGAETLMGQTSWPLTTMYGKTTFTPTPLGWMVG